MLITGTPTGDAHIIEEGGVQGQTEGNNGRNIHPCGLWQGKKFGCLEVIRIMKRSGEGENENRRLAILHVCGLT